jgi:hypothetical protein
MSHPLFDLLNLLDGARLHYRLDRYRPDTVMVIVTVVGERLEIDVFEDGHMEYSRFAGNEHVEKDSDKIMEILQRHGRERDMP